MQHIVFFHSAVWLKPPASTTSAFQSPRSADHFCELPHHMKPCRGSRKRKIALFTTWGISQVAEKGLAQLQGLEGFGEGHEKPAPLGMTMVPGQLGK